MGVVNSSSPSEADAAEGGVPGWLQLPDALPVQLGWLSCRCSLPVARLLGRPLPEGKLVLAW
ncbi:hypothetical protein D3C75_1053280 [compost metagenome]